MKDKDSVWFHGMAYMILRNFDRHNVSSLDIMTVLAVTLRKVSDEAFLDGISREDFFNKFRQLFIENVLDEVKKE